MTKKTKEMSVKELTKIFKCGLLDDFILNEMLWWNAYKELIKRGVSTNSIEIYEGEKTKTEKEEQK